ncbi:MAG: hypothetical protein JRI22_22445 [Deltaproteobacteria bacterium]|nr:hypothetical protein [Deltaproteobacteria bacterium]
MQELDWSGIIIGAYWPFITVFIAGILRGPISKILTERKLKLSLPNNISLSITTDAAERTLTRLFTEFYFTYKNIIKPWQKELFEKILKSETKLRVRELMPNFNRNDDKHIGALRALRGLGLIEPQYGGSWEAESVIEITSFGKIFVDHLKMKEKGVQ